MAKNVTEIGIEVKGNRKASSDYKKLSGDVTRSNKKIEASFKDVERVSKKTGTSMVSSLKLGHAAVVALAAVAAGKLISAFKKAGSEVEDLTTQFTVLLGSVDAAKERMEELEKFAQTTPFQLTEIAAASRVLQTLTKGALATGAGLSLVGDTAAATGEDFQNLALHVGRAFDGLRNNRPVGESLARLQELGVVSGATRGEIEKLTKQGLGLKAWEVLETQLKKNKGGMNALSKTVTGLTSTFKDQLAGAMRQFLKGGIWDQHKASLKGTVELMNKWLESGIFEKIGKAVAFLGKVWGFAFGLMKAILTDFFRIGKVVITNMIDAFNKLVAAIVKVKNFLVSLLPESMQSNFGGITESVKAFAFEMLELAAGSSATAKFLLDAAKATDKLSEATEKAKAKGGGTGGPEKLAINEKAAAAAAKALEAAEAVQADLLILSKSGMEAELEQLRQFEEQKRAILEKAGKDTILLDEVVAKKKAEIAKQEEARVRDLTKVKIDQAMMGVSAVLGTLKLATAGNKKFAMLNKGIAMTEAVINGAGAVQKALNTPPPFNIPLASLIGALTAVNVGIIASQSFAQGGVIQGPTGGDSVSVNANGGEMILNNAQQKNLFDIANGGGGGASTFSFGNIIINAGNGDPSAIAEAVLNTEQERVRMWSERKRESELLLVTI